MGDKHNEKWRRDTEKQRENLRGMECFSCRSVVYPCFDRTVRTVYLS